MSETLQQFKVPVPWIRIFGTIISLLALLLLYVLPRETSFILKIGVFLLGAFAGGWFFYVETLEAVFEKRKISIDVLMTLAIAGAAFLGAFEESLTIVFLYSITETLESYTVKRTRNTIRSLMNLVPKTAVKIVDGEETIIPVEDLMSGDEVLLRPGDYIPVDGTIINGKGLVNEATVTGESVPVLKTKGDLVLAGTICMDSILRIRVNKPVAESTVARIISLVENAQKRKTSSQLLVERFTRYYNPFVVLFALFLIIGPSLFYGGLEKWVVLAITFLVAASPCALAIATPVSVYASIGTAAKKGILVKGGAHLQALGEITAIAFDKTGTLTLGSPVITEIIGMNEMSDDEVLMYAASLEQFAHHPLAKAILKKAQEKGLETRDVDGFRVLPGEGVVGVVESDNWWLGSYEAARTKGIWKEETSEIAEVKTVAVLAKNGSLVGAIGFEDEIRDEAKKAVEELSVRGIQVFMLTGDRKTPAMRVAKELGIKEKNVFFELSPERKAEIIDTLRVDYKLAMVGDGINDAPALALADIGIAMGIAGTDVALETADVAIMSDEIENIPIAVDVGKRMKQIIMQNVVVSALILFFLMTGVLLGFVNLIGAILVHEVSEALIVGNSLRLLARAS